MLFKQQLYTASNAVINYDYSTSRWRKTSDVFPILNWHLVDEGSRCNHVSLVDNVGPAVGTAMSVLYVGLVSQL